MNLVARYLLTGAIAVYALAGIAADPARPAPAGFVTVHGNKLYIDGQTIRIKGTNYYPREHMWADLWNSWDWPAITTESAMIRDLGMNAVRILVPYSHGGWGGANPPESRLEYLENLVNLMGQNGIRSCVTLFDWETSYPAAGTAREKEHLSYLSAIVGRLRDNPYVFMWDVKNEPDHPSAINGHDDWDKAPAEKAKIISWLQRMCQAVRTSDPNHPVSVGIRWYNNVPDILSVLDIACFHSYWSAITNNTEIPTIKAAMGANPKPILAQEFGWPSNPTPCLRDGNLINDYNETQQLSFYQQELAAFENHDIAGCLQWMTFDAKSYTSSQTESFEHYFGLWRFNYTLKPAGVYYRDNFLTRPFPGAPPAPPAEFAAQALDTAVKLTWRAPQDVRYRGTVVRVKKDGFPTGPDDGSLVCDRAGSPGIQEAYVHPGLANGAVYFYAAFAYDADGAFSEGVQAVGQPRKPDAGDHCGAVRQVPEGTAVSLVRKVVTAVFPADGASYVLETDRSAGIRVETVAPGVAVGDIVNISGAARTRVISGIPSERTIAQAEVVRVNLPPLHLPPYSMTCRALGGDPLPPFLAGVKDSDGINTIGQLVRISGRVTLIIGVVMFVDDGTGVADTVGRTGIMVRCPTSTMPVVAGDFVTVTGIHEGSVPAGWTENRRFIHVRDWSDVIRIN